MLVQNHDTQHAAGSRQPNPDMDSNSDLVAIPASAYTLDDLADIYNQTRVDYIVPMPMNGKRLGDYVSAYDIDLDASLVVLTPEEQVLAISMLGLREDRAWITRLGVLPVKRRRGTGQFIMDHHLHMARRAGANQVQLEVIKGNEPAHNLFKKNGFMDIRELLIIRRPPGAPSGIEEAPIGEFSEMTPEEIEFTLAQRGDQAAWTEENITFSNIDGIKGLRLETASGGVGHLIYQETPFQFAHLILCPAACHNFDLATGLLFHLHQNNPQMDTKVENVALDDPLLPVFQYLGYVEVFRRIEMVHLVENTPSGHSHH